MVHASAAVEHDCPLADLLGYVKSFDRYSKTLFNPKYD
jgi:hypothetical protein